MPSPESSRRNLENARQRGQIKLHRCRDESKTIKLLAWQSRWDSNRPPSQRQLARCLGVSQPYVNKLLKKASTVGMDQLLKHGRVTFADLEHARSVTGRMRERAPGLFVPALQPRAPGEPQARPRASNPYRVMAEAKTLRQWQERERREKRRGGWFRW